MWDNLQMFGWENHEKSPSGSPICGSGYELQTSRTRSIGASQSTALFTGSLLENQRGSIYLFISIFIAGRGINWHARILSNWLSYTLTISKARKFVHHKLAGRVDQRRENELWYSCPQKIRYCLTCSITWLSSSKRYLNRHLDGRSYFAVEPIQVIAEVELVNLFIIGEICILCNQHVFRQLGIKSPELNNFPHTLYKGRYRWNKMVLEVREK